MELTRIAPRATLATCVLGLTMAALLAACSDDDGSAAGPPSPSPTGSDASTDGNAPPVDSGGGGNQDGGTDAADPDELTAAELAAASALSPLPAVPPSTTNKYANSAAAATLGQMLFFDKSYSGAIVTGSDGTNGGLGAAGETGKVSCASCHGGAALEDNRSKPGNVSLGIDFGTRNALALVNASYYPWTNWGGRFDSQWSLAPAVAENPKNMRSTRLEIAHLVWNKYKAEYEAVFGALDPALDPNAGDADRFPPSGKPKASATDPDGPWELMTADDRTIVNRIFANYGKAIEAYLRKLVSGNSAFDKYVAGNKTAISSSAKRGAKIFLGKGNCVACHSGPTFSDGKFHVLGAPQVGPNVPATDLGRYQDVPALLASAFNVNGAFSDDTTTGKLTGLAQTDALKGVFRTPALRNVAASGPYMHAGQLATLADVVDFYDKGGGDVADAGLTKDPQMKVLGLTATEKADLVELLKTLTGEPVPAALLQSTAK